MFKIIFKSKKETIIWKTQLSKKTQEPENLNNPLLKKFNLHSNKIIPQKTPSPGNSLLNSLKHLRL